ARPPWSWPTTRRRPPPTRPPRPARPGRYGIPRETACFGRAVAGSCRRFSDEGRGRRRGSRPRPRRSSWSSRAMPTPTRIDVREADGVKVIRFHDRQLFDERTVREVADQVAAVLPNDGSPIKLVLDFTDVALVSSSLLSKLILLQRRVDAPQATRRLCEMSGVAHPASRTPTLARLFAIDRDQRAALAAF